MYDFKNFNAEEFLNDLRGVILPDFKLFKDANHAFEIFYAKIQLIIEKHLKKRKITPKEVKQRLKPWISNEVIKLMRKRDSTHNRIE